MQSNKKEVVILAVLILIVTVLASYNVCAYNVASFVDEDDGRLYWPTPGYAFLPLPKKATGFVIQVTVPLRAR